MSKPVIGVLGAHSLSVLYGTVPINFTGLNETYFNAIRNAEGIPMIIPPLEGEELYQLLELCDGLLFPGGEDVDPRLYHENPSPKLGSIALNYDMTCIEAVGYAMKKNLPILGICRGMQIVNVALGGSLYQDVTDFSDSVMLHSQHIKRNYPVHKIFIAGGSVVAGLLNTEEIYTNTMHHQSVKEIGNGLKISAKTEDGIVEALENEDGSIILVQWHPEELTETVPVMKNLFQNFVQKAKNSR